MNRLSQETSPYLLQHAHNPVDWYPWGEEALHRAQTEDKPILVSIGYSACHWCHVMERESFEQAAVADVMNAHFVCIKVDREERPDVDALYMDAVQAMGVQGGWPLNVFLMPDARPFYGVTYLPPRQWVNLLMGIQEAFTENRAQLAQSAAGFAQELNLSDAARYGLTDTDLYVPLENLTAAFEKIMAKADTQKGGMNRAPKFPMPTLWRFLLRYYALFKTPTALQQLTLTLDRMALGGIYDQLGGGFARYSTDADWLAPHFEKMLYDNGQLLSLYADTYSLTKNPLYKQVVYQTIAFAARELRNPNGGFYSALDADSEGVEGKYYTFTTDELQEMLGDDMDWVSSLYHLNPNGNWEHTNILHRTETDAAFAARVGWTPDELAARLADVQARLIAVRSQRIRPGLDDKILTSWNGLMLKGLATAYRVFAEPQFLTLALELALFLKTNLTDTQNPNRLLHTYKAGVARHTGFLDDYATVIDGLLALYQVTFSEEWLLWADQLAQYVLGQFSDPDEPTLFFTDQSGEVLIARRKELFDNVIPASNSMMAENLYVLSLLLDRPTYAIRADKMLALMQPLVIQNPDYLSNWAAVLTLRARPMVEVAIVGPDAGRFRAELSATYRPHAVWCGTHANSQLPLLQDRTPIRGQTAVYVCQNRTCQLPVTSVAETETWLERLSE